MTALLLALVLSAEPTCEHPALSSLQPEQQASACQLLQRPGPAARLDRDALGPVYAQPGFEQARQRNTGALQAFLAQLRVWFESLFESAGAQTYSNITRVLVLALALAIGGAITLRFLGRKQRVEAARRAKELVAAPLVLDDPQVHRARAEQLLASDPREAIREALLSLLSSLERQRFARPDRVKTNRELAAELPGRGAPAELVAAVAPLFAWFDRAFYSLDAVKPDDASRFLADVRRLTERAS